MNSTAWCNLKKFLSLLFLTALPTFAYSAQVTFSTSTSFGKITIGSSKNQNFTVKNSSTKSLRLDSYWFNNTSSYKIVGGTCKFPAYTLGAGKTCTVSVTFTPTVTGTLNGSLAVGYFLGTGWTWAESYLALTGEGLAAAPAPAPTPTPVPTTAWLNVVGNQILNSQGQQVVLKGVNIADPEQLDTKTWERPNTTARSIASLATDQYFSEVVRLPILPGNTAYPNEGFFSTTNGYDVYFKNHIEPVVTDLTSKGIYVIIDLHYVSDYDALYPKVQAFWTYMAPKFKDNPFVIYEIFNEPIYPNDWATWKNTIAQPATNLIRSLAPNNLVFIGGPNWSSNMAGAATNPVTGSNLVYIGHVYSNQTPTMWDSRYGALADKYPLFISEWGFETGGTEGGDINYGQQFESWMRLHKLGWTAWTFDTVWGPRMFNTDWTLKDGTGGEGTFVRDLLIQEHNNTILP
jgi:endoglucanase